jgi:hypothetical protein
MVLFQRKGKELAGDSPDHSSTAGSMNPLDDGEEKEVIKDNLELMYDIVMQIREDPEFAKSIYADCPRLQNLLKKRPDLRPIFEDPNLVRINFEQVYRDEGGVFPEDPPVKKSKKSSIIAAIVNSPCFKVLKVLLLFKKVMGCVMGGGFALVKGFLSGFCCDPADAADALDNDPDADGDGDADDNPQNSANKDALNKAADHMEDPEVQEQMNDLLENDPEGLQEAIENDPELRELRDSNPLCAELMSDPETMKILTDPENLRALGEAPEMIEMDFADPDWAPEPDMDIESGGADVDVPDANADANVDANADADYDVENAEQEERLQEEEGLEGEDGLDEDGLEEEEEEGLADDFELGDQDDGGNKSNPNANKGKQQNKQQKKEGGNQGGFFSQIGTGLTDMVAAELVGVGFSEMTGQDDALGGFEEDAVDDAADQAEAGANGAESAADQAAQLATASEVVMNEDAIGGIEDGMDEVEDTHDEKQEGSDDKGINAAAAGGGAAAGAVAAGGVGVYAATRGGGGEQEGEEEEEEEEVVEKKKKSRFGVVKGWASAVSTAGKEYIAGALLGDDLGEMFVERQEEEKEEDDSKKETDEENPEPKDGTAEDSKDEPEGKKRRGVFRRKR